MKRWPYSFPRLTPLPAQVTPFHPSPLLSSLFHLFSISPLLAHFLLLTNMVSSILKKPSFDPSIPDNYLPISLLPFGVKLLEKVSLYNRCLHFISSSLCFFPTSFARSSTSHNYGYPPKLYLSQALFSPHLLDDHSQEFNKHLYANDSQSYKSLSLDKVGILPKSPLESDSKYCLKGPSYQVTTQRKRQQQVLISQI